MENFDIKIWYGLKVITLTIVPLELAENQYELIYDGSVIGFLQSKERKWECCAQNKILPEECFSSLSGAEAGKIEMTTDMIDLIGQEIDFYLEQGI